MPVQTQTRWFQVTPDKAVYMCQQMLRHKEPQASKHNLETIRLWMACCHKFSCWWTSLWGWKKKPELYIKGVMANVKLPKFAQINELMNNSSAWLETIKFLTCLVLYAIHQMAPFFVISWFHIVWCFTSTYLQQNQTEYEYPISRCVLYQKRKNKNVLFSNHSTQTARYAYWTTLFKL